MAWEASTLDGPHTDDATNGRSGEAPPTLPFRPLVLRAAVLRPRPLQLADTAPPPLFSPAVDIVR